MKINMPHTVSRSRLLCMVCAAALIFGYTQNTLAQSRGIMLEPVPEKNATPITKGTYRALIIGNDKYHDTQGKWPALKTAVSDAKAVGSLLENNYGFTDVRVLENANRRDVLLALQDLSRRIVANDSVLLYYAGHGFMDIETNRGFWVPVDAVGTDQTTFLRNSTVRDEMGVIASRAKHTLLVSDSCFSGTLLRRGARGIPPDNHADLYYQKVANKKSVQIMTAGGMEYVDDDYQNSGHSPFTYFLINELKHNDKPLLTAGELSTNVEKAVANNVDQVPQSGVLQGAGDEMGEFIFIKVDVHVQGIPEDKVKVKVNIIPDQPGEGVDAEPATQQPAPGKPVSREKRYVMPVPTL